MDEEAIQRAMERLASAAEGRADAAEVDAALQRARDQLEALAETTARLEESLPDRISDAVRDGVQAEARPLARQTAETRGLLNAVIRRLERIEGDFLAERNARVDDLGVLVDLITSGWKSVDERLARLERGLETGSGAIVYRMEERRTADSG